MKKVITLIFAALLFAVSGFAQSGTIGDLTWSISNNTLTISGTGAMPDYWSSADRPWNSYRTVQAVDIKDGVTSIGVYAFWGFRVITSIVIPNSVTSIGSSAFGDCTNLASITIPDGVISIDGSAFSGTAWYDNQPDGVVYAGKALYKHKGKVPENTAINIKDGTVSISGNAFFGEAGLISITLPNSMKIIGYCAFFECTNLASVNIPNGVTSIESEAFNRCPSLTSVTIPNSVTSIGAVAFGGCTGLTSITIPKSVTSIGNWAFSGCRNLISVTVEWENPASVTYGEYGDIFDADNIPMQLNVPAGTELLYQMHEIWKDFIIGDFEDIWLGGLTTNAGMLSPYFSPVVTSYYITVPLSVDNITLIATPRAIAATVSGDGVKTLNIGENIFEIVVTGEKGIAKTSYTVTVFRSNDKAFIVEFDHSTNRYISGTINVPGKGDVSVSAINGQTNYYRMTTGNSSGNTTFHFKWASLTCDQTVNLLPNSSYIISLFVHFDSDVTFTTHYDAYGRPGNITTSYTYSSYELNISDDNSVLLTENTSLPVRVFYAEGLSSNITFEKSLSSIKTIEAQKIAVYPNPATDFITINGLQINETIRLFDLNGRLFISRKAASESETVSVSHLPAGLYVVRIGNGQTVKWVKQ
jgi:hypothetical protein